MPASDVSWRNSMLRNAHYVTQISKGEILSYLHPRIKIKFYNAGLNRTAAAIATPNTYLYLFTLAYCLKS